MALEVRDVGLIDSDTRAPTAGRLLGAIEGKFRAASLAADVGDSLAPMPTLPTLSVHRMFATRLIGMAKRRATMRPGFPSPTRLIQKRSGFAWKR
jgi:hypothetical protein